MSNIFEALQHAQRQINPPEGSGSSPSSQPECPVMGGRTTMEQEMVGLFQNIDALFSDSPSKVIQFIGSRASEGVSTIVREFAFMAVSKLGRSVLILDANKGNGDQRAYFQINNNCGWDEAVRDHGELDKAVCRIADSALSVGCFSSQYATTPRILDSYQLRDFFDCLKKKYDFILVDSSPVTADVDSLALSRSVDGTVMVVEADKTRWPVAENTKNNIIKNGGKIMGIVFNKRRFHIPEFIYRRL
jgi:Mrp family chromosome partitioning ATPase